MVSDSILQRLSDEIGIDKYSVLREVIQIQFLEELYKATESKDLFFKGGTALKILFGSNRYSEDLDFTANLSEKKIREIVNFAVNSLRKEYPLVQVKDAKTLSGVSQKIILPVDFSLQPLTIKLDFSLREKVLTPKSGTIFTNLPITTTSIIRHISEEEIMAEKYRAIINRNKGRDLYDFLFLLKRGVKFNVKIVKEKLKYYNEEYNPDEFIKKVRNWKEKEIDEDLRRFLPLRDRKIIPEIKDLVIKRFEEIVDTSKS